MGPFIKPFINLLQPNTDILTPNHTFERTNPLTGRKSIPYLFLSPEGTPSIPALSLVNCLYLELPS